MKTIARILCLSLFCSAIAGWIGIAMFREYADHLVPAILFAVAGSFVGAVSGAAHEIVRCRTNGLTQ